jgi:hypothetical protein
LTDIGVAHNLSRDPTGVRRSDDMKSRRKFVRVAFGSVLGSGFLLTPLASQIQRARAAANTQAIAGMPGDSPGRVSVRDFGAKGDWNGSSGTNDTAAFDAAHATGKVVYVPAGKYLLSALAPWPEGGYLCGDGRNSVLAFDTTGIGITLQANRAEQRQTVYIHDLAFRNVNHIPSSFVLNNFYVNSRLERLYFSDCAATYCIDNQSGYGAKISDCVFSDVSGNGVRFQQTADLMRYSFAASLAFNDFTRVSGHAIDIDGCNVLNMFGGVIEGCGKGLVTNYRGGNPSGQIQSWNINLQGVYFEANRGPDIELNSASNYFGSCAMQACTMIEHPMIHLGTHSKLAIIGCFNPGGEPVRVIGVSGGDARVTLLRSHNYIQEGNFQWFDADSHYDTISTARWAADSGQPAIGNGSLASHWSRLGKRATVDLYFTPGSTTTFGNGHYYFADSFLTLMPMAPGAWAVGTALMYDDSARTYHTGVAEIEGNQVIRVIADGGQGRISPTVPFTWSANDTLKLTITYQSS